MLLGHKVASGGRSSQGRSLLGSVISYARVITVRNHTVAPSMSSLQLPPANLGSNATFQLLSLVRGGSLLIGDRCRYTK